MRIMLNSSKRNIILQQKQFRNRDVICMKDKDSLHAS